MNGPIVVVIDREQKQQSVILLRRPDPPTVEETGSVILDRFSDRRLNGNQHYLSSVLLMQQNPVVHKLVLRLVIDDSSKVIHIEIPLRIRNLA
ncbi:hypothetical protein D3C71_1594070 [compost metagenome]